MPKEAPVTDTPEDEQAGQNRQAALIDAILADTGVEFVEELTHPTEAEEEVTDE